MTKEEIRDEWNETIATDPAKLHDPNTARYSKALASKDDTIEIEIEVYGPEEDAEPVMAHLDDQAVRVLQALENGHPPEESEGKYTIDWEAILELEEGDD
jgi:hypothetical protein